MNRLTTMKLARRKGRTPTLNKRLAQDVRRQREKNAFKATHEKIINYDDKGCFASLSTLKTPVGNSAALPRLRILLVVDAVRFHRRIAIGGLMPYVPAGPYTDGDRIWVKLTGEDIAMYMLHERNNCVDCKLLMPPRKLSEPQKRKEEQAHRLRLAYLKETQADSVSTPRTRKKPR